MTETYDPLPKFANLYRAYDDEALKAYANAGLLRRAKKDVDVGKVTLSDNTDASTIRLISDGQHVVLPAKGLVDAKCDCTSVSVCKHIVASVLYVQEVMQNMQDLPKVAHNNRKEEPTEKIAGAEFTNQPNVLDEILALSLEDIQKVAKKIPKAKRLKAFSMVLSYFDSFPDSYNEESKKGNALDNAQPNTTIIIDTNSLTVQLANQSEPIRYIQGAGFAGMLSKIERDADSYHLLALLEVKRHYYQFQQKQSQKDTDNFKTIKNWLSTTLKSDNNTNNKMPYNAYQLPNATLAMLDDITFDINQLLTQGLSNIDSYSANRMHLNNTLARSHHLPRLASQLRQLSGQMHDYRLGSMHASERQILLSLAELSAYIYQLKNSFGDKLINLRGKLRQSYENDSNSSELTLQPLGANWWHSDSKARGLTLYFYEPNERKIVEMTQARAQMQDSTFDKNSAWYNAVWMTSASQLMHQTSTIQTPRFSEDSDFGGADKLAVTGSHVSDSASFDDSVSNKGGHKKEDSQTNFNAYLRSISAIAHNDWAQLEQDWRQQMTYGDGLDPIILLNPAKIGQLLIDEIEQCVWWQLADERDNYIRLRLNWNTGSQNSITKIKKLECLNLQDIQIVVAKISFNNGAHCSSIELTPISLVMQSDLFNLDYDDVPDKKHTLKELLSGKINKLMSKKCRPVEIENKKPATLTQQVCEPILDVLDSLCASGRLQPTSNQIKTLREQHKLASDAELIILASAIKPVYNGNKYVSEISETSSQPITIQDKYRLQSILKLAYLCKQMRFLQVEMPIFLNTQY